MRGTAGGWFLLADPLLSLGDTHHGCGSHSRLDVHGNLPVMNRLLSAQEIATLAKEQ